MVAHADPGDAHAELAVFQMEQGIVPQFPGGRFYAGTHDRDHGADAEDCGARVHLALAGVIILILAIVVIVTVDLVGGAIGIVRAAVKG